MGGVFHAQKEMTMKRNVTLATRTLALSSCFGFALATGMPEAKAHGNQVDMFQSMDANADGKISVAEHAATAKAMFEKMDADHDGSVTEKEMTAAHQKITGQKPGAGEMSAADKIKAVDTNGDGKLTAEEHQAGSKMMFEKMDADHDGFLTKAEMVAGHTKLMHKGGK
jgi:Ca2+-binding EF-hand superfamily protein